MKRIILSFILIIGATISFAQGIYTKVTKYDKFDDVVSERVIKTLITKTDSTFIVETKGQEPVEYRYIDNPLFSAHVGRRDSLANIVADVYGYEDQYIAITEDVRNEVIADVQKEVENLPDSLVFEEKINMLAALKLMSKLDELPTITVRTISRYEHIYEYETDLFWIKFKDGSRIIYTKR